MKGRGTSALPLQGSNVDLLRYCKSIIHIDAEIADSTLYFGMAEQKLHGSQIPGAAADECRFGSSQRVRTVQVRV
jgi:hypothetical protein